MGGEPVLHGAIVVRRVAPNVEQPNDAREALAVEDVLEDPAERRTVGLAGLSVTVPWQVEKVEGCVR